MSKVLKKIVKVKDTYLSKALVGDVIMFFKGEFDPLGELIVRGEGNLGYDENNDGKRDEGFSDGYYTHSAFVKELPDPEAEVELVRIEKGTDRQVFKVKDPKKAGKMVHATWPVIKKDPIKWENVTSELWRIRNFSREYSKLGESLGALRAVKWASNRIGKIYNWLQFLTFGLIRFSGSWICSGLIFDAVRNATQFTDYPVILSPEGHFDSLPTPNDLINSKQMFRVRYTGLLAGNPKKK